jgi:phosphoribosylamine--glycine ligase
MKILVIGQGGREHALVRAFAMSPSVSEVHVLPGSDGMSKEALCHSIDWRDFEAVVQFCVKNEISFVFVGPEDPLVSGLCDFLRERGILAVGPSKEAAQLEGSKVFAKHFMQDAKIPTAFFEEVYSVNDVVRLSGRFTPPYVLKADGLAAGKGVFICKTLDELKMCAEDLFDRQTLGAAGAKAILEQYTPGWELSYLIVTNGTEFQTLPLSQDHKRLLDGDEGPNTGGMGTVAPVKISEELQSQIEEKIIKPTLQQLQQRHFIYRGVLYFGLMINEKGPSLLEYNCRFGDPETQVILPLLDGDIGHVFREVALGKCPPLKTKNIFASCVVMAAPGYPNLPEKGVQIEGDIESQSNSSYFIHAGTKATNHTWTTNGGRVLCALGLGSTLQESLLLAYTQSNKVKWRGLQKRHDIGAKFSNGKMP